MADYIGELLRSDGAIAALGQRPGLAQRLLEAVNRLLGRKVSNQERAVYAELADRLRSVAGAGMGDAEPTPVGGLTGKPGTHATTISSASNSIISMAEQKNNSENKEFSPENTRYSVEAESFTNEEIARSVEAVARMEPVVEISPDAFPIGDKNLTNLVSTFFDSLGNRIENSQLGQVIIDRRGVKSDISHGIGRMKAASFAAVPDVIENGRIIDYQKNWKERGYDTAIIAAPITIGNEPYIAGVVLERSRGENRFYLHEVLTEKEDVSSFWTGATIAGGLPGDKTPSILSLLHKVREVKENLSEDARYSVEQESIKQQIVANQETLNKMSPVANIISDGFKGLTKQQHKAQVLKLLKSTDFEIDRQGFGKIVFDEKRLNSSMNYAQSDAERVAFAAIPQVLKRGVEISGHDNHKNRGYDTVTIGAPVILNGQRGNMAVIVRLTGKNYYKAHRVLMPDGSLFILPDTGDAEPTPGGGFTGDPGTLNSPISSASNDSISNSEQNGKSENEKFLTDGTRYSVEDLPAKARDYLQREENRLTGRIAKLMGVPYQARREQLRPIVRQISEQYLDNGEISEAAADQLFEEAWAAGIVISEDFYNENKALRDELRQISLMIADKDKQHIPDYNDWIKRQFGTIRVVKSGGVPVDVHYQELAAENMSLFPEDITHPADQLRRIAEVANSIKKIEETLDRYYGNDAEFYKQAARHEFDTLLMNHTPELDAVKNYFEQAEREKAEKERMLKLGGMSLDAQTTQMIKDLWGHEKAAKKVVDKATARNLLTEYDNLMVDKLLKGELTLNGLPKGVNYRGIKELYEARQRYEELMGQIRDFNRTRKAALRQEADGLLENALEWKDKSAGLLYQRETMERNIYDIVPDREEADRIVQRYFAPVHRAEAERTKMKNEYRERVHALNLSRKVQKGNKVSEAAAVQLLGEALDNIEYLSQPYVVKRGEDSRNGHTLAEWKGIRDDVLGGNPNMDMDKIKNAVDAFQKIYDELFEKMNEARIRNGYEPVDYRRGYFPHFQNNQSDSILAKFGRALGIEMNVSELPTSINGITHTFQNKGFPNMTQTGTKAINMLKFRQRSIA